MAPESPRTPQRSASARSALGNESAETRAHTSKKPDNKKGKAGSATQKQDSDVFGSGEGAQDRSKEGSSSAEGELSGQGESEDEDEEDEDDQDEEDEEQEPQLKYQRLTANLSTLYRNGDAASCFAVRGDKIIFGTHNGNIVACSIPGLNPLRVYHAHSASISAVSISPVLSSVPLYLADSTKTNQGYEQAKPVHDASSQRSASVASPTKTIKSLPIANTPTNAIHIASASIDGHVCVASLVDPKDVTLRNFGRPISAVALSPNYKNDRSYLSGGLAGNLILTIGGKAGASVNANTNSAAAAASGWLSSIGLGSGSGSDKVLHSGEGAISAIEWSLSAKYVAWVNEHGVKIMRTGNKLDSTEQDVAWTRIGHIDRPKRSNWNELSAGWRPRLEWVDDATLEADGTISSSTNGVSKLDATVSPSPQKLNPHSPAAKTKRRNVEKLIIGWGDAIWIVHVKADTKTSHHSGHSPSGGSAVVVHHLYLDDCVISGVSLYSSSLLLVLAYRKRDDNDHPLPVTPKGTPRRGVQHRQNGLSPEIRLINVITKEELDADTLTMSRYESLGARDYHLGKTYFYPPSLPSAVQRGTLEAISGGLWDASMSATRLFSSNASVRSGTGSTDGTIAPVSVRQPTVSLNPQDQRKPEQSTIAIKPGVKVFVLSPYDCVLAQKRDLTDRLSWLVDHKQFQEAWELAQSHPEIVTATSDDTSTDAENQSSTIQNGQSLADFLASDSASQTTVSGGKSQKRAAEHESRRIGELWMEQLVESNDWTAAGEVASRVLGASPRWEYWVSKFMDTKHFDEITMHVPITTSYPRLPSSIYERLLRHYVVHDRPRFKSLIDNWDPQLYNNEHVAHAIEEQLTSGIATENSEEDGIQGRDWRLLLESLATLKIASNRPEEAVRCYIQLHNADDAMNLITENGLVSTIADDVASFITLRISNEQLATRDISVLEDLSREAMRMLVDESVSGAILPRHIVQQLQAKGNKYQPFVFLYLRALWQGQGTGARSHRTRQRLELQGHSIVEEFGNDAVALFAEFDRTILMEFLRYSRSYSYEQATAECEKRQYYPELVYLLSQTGQTKRALDLIINFLGDVKFAIEFAKEQGDSDLWDDLLDFSMDKPKFIRGLLEGVGTAIDPIKLVRGIPEGLEIEGLRDGIRRIVREYELQSSISQGVAKVLQGEVASGMDQLRTGRARAVKFELDLVDEKAGQPPNIDGIGSKTVQTSEEASEKEQHDKGVPRPGHCCKCDEAFHVSNEDILIGFACGHVYHLACLIALLDDHQAVSIAEQLESQIRRTPVDAGDNRSVGTKMAHAHLIKSIIGRGCPHCHRLTVEE